MKYLGIKKQIAFANVEQRTNTHCKDVLPYKSLGDKILEAMHYEVKFGVEATPQYDKEDSTAVDILTSPNHDFFDIAEMYGQVVPLPTPTPTEETVDTETN